MPTRLTRPNFLPLQLPEATSAPEFDKQLFGNVEELITQMLHGVVVGSYTNEWVLEKLTAPDFDTWRRFGSRISTTTPLGQGTYNTTYKVGRTMLPDAFKGAFHGVDLPDMIFRRTRVDPSWSIVPEVDEAVKELIITGYAALNSIGPKLYGAYMIKANPPIYVENEEDRLVKKARMYMFTEAWDGDLFEPLSKLQIPRDRFAQQLSILLGKAQEIGLWHIDANPTNLLYRNLGPDTEICFTDFDDKFCKIWSPSMRARVGRCSVLAHASLIMGYMSCYMNPEVFAFYQPAVLAQLNLDFGIDMTTDSEVCDWLDGMEREQTPSASVVSGSQLDNEREAKLQIAETLRITMRQYLMNDEEFDGSCLLKRNLSKTTFVQFFEFALSRRGNPPIESWSKLVRKYDLYKLTDIVREDRGNGRVHFFEGKKGGRLVRMDINGQVYHYEGPRGEEKLVRLKNNEANYYYEGPRGQERVVRITALKNKGVEYYEGPRGEEHRVSIVKYVEGIIEYYEGPRGAERKVRVSRRKDAAMEYYEGRQGEERMVRVEYPGGSVEYFDGPSGKERKLSMKAPASPLPMVEPMDAAAM